MRKPDTRSDHRSVELTDGVRLGSAGGNGLVSILLDCVPIAQTANRPEQIGHFGPQPRGSFYSSVSALLGLGLPHSSKRHSLASRSVANLSNVLARSDHIFLASGVVAVCAILTQSSAFWRHSPGSTGIKSSIFEERLIRKWSKHEPAFTIRRGLTLSHNDEKGDFPISRGSHF
jgi:hypothetical protein